MSMRQTIRGVLSSRGLGVARIGALAALGALLGCNGLADDRALTPPPAVRAQASTNAMNAMNVGDLRIPSTTLTDLSKYTFAQTEVLCPATRLGPQTIAGKAASVVLPRWLVLKSQFERVREACCATPPCGSDECNQLTVAIDEDFDANGSFDPGGGVDQTVSYEVFSGIGLACADRGYRPFLLHPVSGPEVQALVPDENDENKLKVPTFTTYFRYLCIQSWDEAQGKSVYRCGKGRVADGVSGYAIKEGTNSPRPVYLSSLTWGANVWDKHFQFLSNHLASIVESKQGTTPVAGYALDYAWNLNPRDVHAGTSTKKEADYLAAVAVKTATSRSGVAVSPYNRANLTGGQPSSADELNQGEPGYATMPDLASKGTLDGVAIDLRVAPWYTQSCPWATDWGLPELTPQPVTGGSAFPIGTGTNEALLGLNLGDSAPRRCPTFATCEPGQSCCMGRFALGEDNTCVVKSDGSLWCFGENFYGQLGRGVIDGGSSMARPVLWQKPGNPTQIETLPGVLDTFVGKAGACARRGDGSVYCWGNNDLGQVGDGSTITRLYPVAVTGLGTSVAVEMGAAGASFRCVRRTDGTVWCWGGNVNGELGDGTTLTRPNPVALTSLGTTTAELDLGWNHGCARRFDGGLWCWGANASGQLGDGTTQPRSTPAAVTALGTALVTGISLGGDETCVRLSDGTVSCWGKNYFGQIGDGSTIDRKGPVSITALGTTVVELSTGSLHSCARHSNGGLSCWGYGYYGQIGDGSKVDRWFPVAVTGVGLATTELASGGTHSCARRLDGSLWCWGNNWKGQLGTGSPRGTSTPTLALSLRCHCGDAVCSRAETLASCPVDCRKESYGDKKCTGTETEATHPNDCQRVAYGQLASGRWHSCALRPDGSLWCWGKNHLGQMGDGTTLSRFTPTKITALGTAVSSFALGAAHGCARLTNGTVKCWGNNNYGQVGDNSTVRKLSPVAITALGTATVSLGLGYEHSCAVMADKKLRCWGSNFWSTIGDGTATDRLLPVAVTTLGTQAAQVTGGHDHTCARLTTNAVKCWGRSDVGQVGDGSTAVRTRPVAITALGSVVAAVAAGDYHTCATRTDGKLYCWGMNGAGEVGDGSTTLRKLPVVVTALGTTVAEIRTGASQSCARLQNGTVSCWGRNDSGQLGDGSTVNRWLPGPVATLSGVTAIAAGEVHNCARRSDGSLWCWGANWSGSLGAAAGGYAWTPFAQSRCGDGICAYDEAEDGWCSADCATTCGDCVCDGVLETAANCAADCVAGNTCTPAVCGNGSCNAGEDCGLCPADCGTCY